MSEDVRVIGGVPTADELAVVIALVTSRGGPSEPAPVRRGGWNDPARAMRQPLRPGPGAWRASAL